MFSSELLFKVTHNNFLFFFRLTELDVIFQLWKCTFLMAVHFFFKLTIHCTFHCV